jgi:hypothetical protein
LEILAENRPNLNPDLVNRADLMVLLFVPQTVHRVFQGSLDSLKTHGEKCDHEGN